MGKKPTIYTVATAHLDTVWNWDFETTVREYIPATLDKNFRLFKKYPDYVFSFEGSRRYELMEEYYPEKFGELKKYIAEGRWFVTGSAYENGDVNVPSPEALFRNILYGNTYFYEKFGKKSVDIYLPDCFGFGYALPSVIAHSNLKGFTTQKLTWSSAYGIPFDLGWWQGVDGSKIYASLDAQNYSSTVTEVREHKNAPKKLQKNIKEYGLPMTYLLHGTGDRGGSPTDRSVKTVVSEHKKNPKSDIDVEIVSVDKVFRIMDSELSDEQKNKLPVWNNELVSTDHGVGGYTSRAIGKRWNKRNEQLADAAERMSVLADWLGASKYPQGELDTAWKRVIAHQFHDDLPGTSLHYCYKRSWNDYMLSLNNFGTIYTNAVTNIASHIENPFKTGVTVAVSNPTQYERSEAVECRVSLPKGTKFVKVVGTDGKETPSQYQNGKVVFTAALQPNSIALYNIRPSAKPFKENTGLSVSCRELENVKYIVKLSQNGDISSVFDKENNRELLKKPVSMAIHRYNGSAPWPAWELDYPEVQASPAAYAENPQFEVEENGAARAVIKTVRKACGSVFVQRIILGESSDFIRVENEIEWRSSRSLLKTPFTFTVSNEQVSYDLGLGVIKRGLNTPKLYEVPAQNWADISGENFGISVLSDCKFGWDHPEKDTIRLTGIHTPRGDYSKESQQSGMDLGLNRYAFGIFSHSGNCLEGTQSAGIRFCQPPAVFSVPESSDGVLPSNYSFVSISDNGVVIRAVKKENNGGKIVIRVNEAVGREHKKVRIRAGGGILSAVEAYASEEYKAEAKLVKGEVEFGIKPYEPKTFIIELKPFKKKVSSKKPADIELDFNVRAASCNANRIDGVFGGMTLPSEQFPEKVRCGENEFKLPFAVNNAVSCHAQKLSLPKGAKSVSLLLTSVKGDREAVFTSGTKKYSVKVCDCFESIGAWDLYSMHETGRIKDCTLAYEFTHMHRKDGDEIAKQCYLFKVVVPVSGDTLCLPDDKNIIVFAAQANFEDCGKALYPLYDELEKRPFTYKRSGFENRMTKYHRALSLAGQFEELKKVISRL